VKRQKLFPVILFLLIGISNSANAVDGDMNCDGVVDLADFFLLADDFGKSATVTSICADPFTDINCDGRVDFSDFFLFADNFGKEGTLSLACYDESSEDQNLDEETLAVSWTPHIVSNFGEAMSASVISGDGGGFDQYFRNSGVVIKDGFYYAVNGVHPVERNNYTAYYPKSLIKASISSDTVQQRCAYYGSSSGTPSVVNGSAINHEIDMEALTFGPDGGSTYIYVGDEYNFIYQIRLSDCGIAKQWNLADIGVSTGTDKGIEALAYSTDTGYFYAGIQDDKQIHEIQLSEINDCSDTEHCGLTLINTFSTNYSPSGMFYYPEQSLLYVFAGTTTNGDQYLDAYTTAGSQKCAITIPAAVGISRGDGFFINGTSAYIADSQGPMWTAGGAMGYNLYRVRWTDPCNLGGPVYEETTETIDLDTSTAQFHAPAVMADVLQAIRTVAWNANTAQITDLVTLSLGIEGTQDLVILNEADALYDAGLSVEEGMAASTEHSNDKLLRATFKLIEVGIDTYIMSSAKHSNYAVDVATIGGTETLVFRDYRSYYLDPATAAFLTFTFTQSGSATFVKAAARHVYDADQGAYVMDATWSALNVAVSGSSVILSEEAGSAFNTFTAYAPVLATEIPFDFNPFSTSRVDNDEFLATWDGSDKVQDALKDISSTYEAQVAVAGLTDVTTNAANSMLAAIDSISNVEGATLRYPTSFYQTVRENMLRRKVEVSDLYNSVVGQLTIPYVLFTNEADAEGVHHPFMVIVSYGATEGMTQLWDVPRPPGDGISGGYTEQTVTRNANLGAIFAKIPMRDYGLITVLTENDMVNDLASDMSETNLTVLNYASTSATGIAIDGVVVYPAYNNTLNYSSSPGEISSVGIHSGRGLGLHYHADAHGANGNGLNLYNTSDYADYPHPPIISFGFDGIAGYARYALSDQTSEGVDVAFDEWGGHDHGIYAYHYHSEKLAATGTTSGGSNVAYSVHTLPPKGAWRGRINDIPDFWSQNAPAYGGRPGIYQGFE